MPRSTVATLQSWLAGRSGQPKRCTRCESSGLLTHVHGNEAAPNSFQSDMTLRCQHRHIQQGCQNLPWVRPRMAASSAGDRPERVAW